MSTRPRGKTPLKPSHLFVLFGVILAGGTALSGILGTADHFEDPSHVSRALFVDIPSPMKLVFYSLLPVLFLWAAWQLSLRAKNWERGAPDRRITDRLRF